MSIEDQIARLTGRAALARQLGKPIRPQKPRPGANATPVEKAIASASVRAGKLAEMRWAAEKRIERRQQKVVDLVTGHVSAAERDTWDLKRAAAEAEQAGTASVAQQAMLDAECAYTGETRGDLVTLILEKSAAYQSVIGAIRGIHRKAIHAVKSATTKDEIRVARQQLEIDLQAFREAAGLEILE